MVTPFVYARLPTGLLGPLAMMVFILWLVILHSGVAHRDQAPPLGHGDILLVMLGACLWSTGRHTADITVVRWAAKHICPAYIWLCSSWAAGWDALWLKVREHTHSCSLS